jgi:hypothetical protein
MTESVGSPALLAGEEAELDPAEDVIHDGFGVADVLVAGPAGGLEAGVRELLAQDFERDAVLEGERGGGGEAVHEAGDGGAFFGHADEDFAGLAVGVEADGDVAFVAGDGEFVGERGALVGKTMANGARRTLLMSRSGAGSACAAVARAAVNAVVAPRMDFEAISTFSATLASRAFRSASAGLWPEAIAVRMRSAVVVSSAEVPLMSLALAPSETLRGCAPFDPSR